MVIMGDDELSSLSEYDLDKLLLIYADEGGESGSYVATIEKCILGCFESLRPFLSHVVTAALLQLIINILFDKSRNATNLLTGLVGVGLFWANSDRIELMMPLLLYFAVTTCVIFSKANLWLGKGIACSLFTVLFNAICQLIIGSSDFNSIRGALMIAAMKQISLAFDLETEEEHSSDRKNGGNAIQKCEPSISVRNPSFCSTIAFVFNPSTLLFGPPLPFNQFEGHANQMKEDSIILRLLNFAYHLAISFLFLIGSSCLLDPELGPLQQKPIPWLFKYFLIAQSFRFSHFFVSHFATACAHLGGLPLIEITFWTAIEWPRSMADVVVFWNVPMHSFLHKYVYRRVKGRLNNFASISLTFAVSSALHGLDIQMTAVLLSLGFCAFSETKLRDRLSAYFSACLRSKNCPDHCGHCFKRNSTLVIFARLLFTFVNVFHLIYLGAPFHGQGQFEGYSVDHLFNIWAREFRFSGHLLALFTLFVSFLIPLQKETFCFLALSSLVSRGVFLFHQFVFVCTFRVLGTGVFRR